MGDGRFGLGATCIGLAGPHPGTRRALQPRNHCGGRTRAQGSELQELARHSVVEAGLGPGLLQAFVHSVAVSPATCPAACGLQAVAATGRGVPALGLHRV